MEIKKLKAFTLVELLVVMAIVAILATVMVVNLGSYSKRARISSARQTMDSIRSLAAACFNDGSTLNVNASSVPVVGNNVCTDNVNDPGTWPNLPSSGSWAYNAVTNNTVGSSAWTFSATGDSTTVTCNANGCS